MVISMFGLLKLNVFLLIVGVCCLVIIRIWVVILIVFSLRIVIVFIVFVVFVFVWRSGILVLRGVLRRRWVVLWCGCYLVGVVEWLGVLFFFVV